MPLAYHLILTAYGFWLPNDPRGSRSKWVWSDELYKKFGSATRVEQTRSHAHDVHDAHARRRAKEHLKYPAVRFTGRQAQQIGCAFREYLRHRGIRVYAAALMPDHVHMVLDGRDLGSRTIELVANQLKQKASRLLREAGLHPLTDYATADGSLPTCWALGQWVVYLNDVGHVENAIRYVDDNPPNAGLPRQRWSFVSGWSG